MLSAFLLLRSRRERCGHGGASVIRLGFDLRAVYTWVISEKEAGARDGTRDFSHPSVWYTAATYEL